MDITPRWGFKMRSWFCEMNLRRTTLRFGDFGFEVIMNQQRYFLLCIAIVLITSFTACTQSALNIARESAERFHAQLDAEQYHAIYVEADAELHHNFSESAFTEQLRSSRARLGKVKETPKLLGDDWLDRWQFGLNTPNEKTKTAFTTQFDEGLALEEFEWKVQNGAAKLINYKVQGPIYSGKGKIKL